MSEIRDSSPYIPYPGSGLSTEQAQSGGRGQGQAAMEHGTWNMERESRQETETGPSTEAAEKLRNREWGLQIRSILVASG